MLNFFCRIKVFWASVRNHAPETMFMALFSMTFLFITVPLSGCHQKEGVQPQPHWFKYYTQYQEEGYIQYLESQINSEQDTTLRAVMIRNYYPARDFRPFWTQNGLQEASVDTLLARLDDASRLHGIPGEYFRTDSIRHAITRLKEHQIPNDEALYSFLYGLERQLTDQYVRYACALSYGAVDPKAVHGRKWYYETLSPDSAFIQVVLGNLQRFDDYLKELYPQTAEYLTLQKEMQRLLSQPDTLLQTIPYFRVRKNGQSEHIPALCRRLNHHGITVDTNLNTLDETVLRAVNSFRRNHGIPESDTIDKETVEKLNLPLQQYCDVIAANLERQRWQFVHRKNDDTVYIAVNIPDYSVCAVQNGNVMLRNRICCGRTQNPANVASRYKNGLVVPYKAETPLMFSRIRSIVLNPEWNIPYDIIKNEYYPKLVKSNTAVVNREHLYIKDSRNGRYVVPDSINWSKVNRNNIPYRLHQTSGRYNALGIFKFVFSNSESVYLHDTNNKGAFKRRKRALSHGCVRVENPASVAEWIYAVNKFDTNYIEQLHIILGEKPTSKKGEKYLEKQEEKELQYYESLSDYDRRFYRKLRPSSVNLRKSIPLFIEYHTCFVGENDTVQYRDDVYYKDGNILYLLQNPGR